MSARYIHCTGRGDRYVQIRLTLSFLGVDCPRLLNNFGVDRVDQGLPSWIAWSDRWTSFHPLLFHFFILPPESQNLSLFRCISSLLLFILAISLYRDIKSVIFSTLDIFSFVMLLVDTIYFLLYFDSLGPMVVTNCSRTRLEPRKRFEHSFGQSVPCSFLSAELSISRSLRTRMVPAKGTPTLKSDFSTQHSMFKIR